MILSNFLYSCIIFMVSFLVYFCLNLLTYKMYMKNMKLKVLLVLCALLLLSAFIAERKEPITIFMIGDSTMANKSLKMVI